MGARVFFLQKSAPCALMDLRARPVLTPKKARTTSSSDANSNHNTTSTNITHYTSNDSSSNSNNINTTSNSSSSSNGHLDFKKHGRDEDDDDDGKYEDEVLESGVAPRFKKPRLLDENDEEVFFDGPGHFWPGLENVGLGISLPSPEVSSAATFGPDAFFDSVSALPPPLCSPLLRASSSLPSVASLPPSATSLPSPGSLLLPSASSPSPPASLMLLPPASPLLPPGSPLLPPDSSPSSSSPPSPPRF
ncbi:hypothetical protein DFQ26_004550 [Actinomortierella ambigua]|nr:hypothetical protein DFQ26_004550 [Actinomortierella ambigua]